MKAKELKKLKDIYELKRQSLINMLSKDDGEIDVDGDDVDEIQGKNIIRVAEQLRKKAMFDLNRIQVALDRINDSDYGDCEECGEEIGFRRLEALPGVGMCVTCAEHAEIALR